MFKLSGLVDGSTQTMVSILTKDANSVTFLSKDLCCSIDHFEGWYLVVIYTGDIDNSTVGMDHFCIISDDASIISPIDK